VTEGRQRFAHRAGGGRDILRRHVQQLSARRYREQSIPGLEGGGHGLVHHHYAIADDESISCLQGSQR
jgi:hypothetical protein